MAQPQTRGIIPAGVAQKDREVPMETKEVCHSGQALEIHDLWVI